MGLRSFPSYIINKGDRGWSATARPPQAHTHPAPHGWRGSVGAREGHGGVNVIKEVTVAEKKRAPFRHPDGVHI